MLYLVHLAVCMGLCLGLTREATLSQSPSEVTLEPTPERAGCSPYRRSSLRPPSTRFWLLVFLCKPGVRCEAHTVVEALLLASGRCPGYVSFLSSPSLSLHSFLILFLHCRRLRHSSRLHRCPSPTTNFSLSLLVTSCIKPPPRACCQSS